VTLRRVIPSLDGKEVGTGFVNAAEFRCLRVTVTNQHFTNYEIKSRLNCENTCYHSVQNLLSSRLLPKNVKIWKKVKLSLSLTN
jgi:hypothetical protein